MIRYETRPARAQEEIDAQPFHRYVMDDDKVWTEFYRSGKDYLLRFPDLADFEVSADGSVVVAHPCEETDAVTLEHLYINQLVPLALSRQGRPSYHASVVTVPGGAVAFLGESGAGKSTLAASFALNEAAFLTDDALIVEEADGGCRALPSHASVRLWGDSVEALVGNLGRQQATCPWGAASYISYSDKARLLAGDALTYNDEPQLLLAAYVLGGEDARHVSIEPLTGLDRYMAWISNSFLLDIEDHDLLKQHFDWTHRISGIVPTFALDYPHDYGMLPDVRLAVQQHLATLGT